MALHDDRCATRKGFPCNCASAAFKKPTHSETSHFKSDTDQPKDRIGTMDERCANCRTTFGDHYNGRCPLDEE